MWTRQDVDDVAVLLYTTTGWGDARPPLNAAERRVVVRELNKAGLSDREITVRLGIASRTVVRIRMQMGIPAAYDSAKRRVVAA